MKHTHKYFKFKKWHPRVGIFVVGMDSFMMLPAEKDSGCKFIYAPPEVFAENVKLDFKFTYTPTTLDDSWFGDCRPKSRKKCRGRKCKIMKESEKGIF
jgi:hypothetical protein